MRGLLQLIKKEKSSKFIESILLNVPVPPIYFAEDEYGNWLVLDGLQRLTSIFNFYKGSFTLDKLTVLDDLNGKKYSQLDEYQTLLDTGLLRVNVISRDSDPDVKYDVFMRLNQGAETLNFQELRNCLYRGSFNDALKGMCKDNILFLKVAMTSLVSKFQVFVENCFEEYRNTLNGKNFDNISTCLRLNSIYILLRDEGCIINKFKKGGKDKFTQNTKKELFDCIQTYFVAKGNIKKDNFKFNTVFPIGKTGKGDLLNLFKQISLDKWPNEDFEREFDKIDSILNIRNSIIHEDRDCHLTKKDVEENIDFVKYLVKYIDNYLYEQIPT